MAFNCFNRRNCCGCSNQDFIGTPRSLVSYISGPTGPVGPIGPTGPTGPTGPAGTGVIPGAFYATQTATETVATTANILIDSAPVQQNITYDSATGTFTVANSGTYLANWTVVATNSSGGALELSVSLVRTSPVLATISSADSAVTIANGETTTLNGNAIVQASAGDTFALRNTSTATITLPTATLANTTISMIRIY